MKTSKKLIKNFHSVIFMREMREKLLLEIADLKNDEIVAFFKKPSQNFDTKNKSVNP
jgi:hypothetical protein